MKVHVYRQQQKGSLERRSTFAVATQRQSIFKCSACHKAINLRQIVYRHASLAEGLEVSWVNPTLSHLKKH